MCHPSLFLESSSLHVAIFIRNVGLDSSETDVDSSVKYALGGMQKSEKDDPQASKGTLAVRTRRRTSQPLRHGTQQGLKKRSRGQWPSIASYRTEHGTRPTPRASRHISESADDEDEKALGPRTWLDHGKTDPFSVLPGDFSAGFLAKQVHLCKVLPQRSIEY